MGRVHTEALRRVGGVEISAIGGRNESAVQKLAATFGIARTETDIHRLIDDSGIDAVHICTPNSLHFKIARAALEAGKHVLCEKPLATSSKDAAGLVALARSKKLRNCT